MTAIVDTGIVVRVVTDGQVIELDQRWLRHIAFLATVTFARPRPEGTGRGEPYRQKCARCYKPGPLVVTRISGATLMMHRGCKNKAFHANPRKVEDA